MQVILLKDVPKVGRQYDIKSVADGFALNMLFPRGLAERATPEKVAKLESRRAEIAHLVEASSAQLAEALKKLDGTEIAVSGGKANEQGSLYKGVDAEMLAEALSKAADAQITTDHFNLGAPIKTTGSHPLVVTAGDATASVMILVKPE